MRFLFTLLIITSLGTAAFAKDRPPSRLGNILGYATLSEDVSTQGSVLVFECGKEGLHLRVSAHEADMPKNALKGVERMTTRTVLFARAPNGQQAYFGFEGEAVTNGSGYLISEYIYKGGKTKKIDQYDDLSTFLTVYFSPKVKLGIATERVSKSASAKTALVGVKRNFDRAQILGADQFQYFRSLCQMAASKKLDTLDPPDCTVYSETINNMRTKASYSDDVFARQFKHEYKGELFIYGSETKITVSGVVKKASKGRLELAQSEKLSISYEFPSIQSDDATLDVLQALTGEDALQKAMQADPVNLKMTMPDGTVLTAKNLKAGPVQLPDAVLEKFKTNAEIKVSATSVKGTITFSETIELSGFSKALGEMTAGLKTHKEALGQARACREIGGGHHYIFDAANK